MPSWWRHNDIISPKISVCLEFSYFVQKANTAKYTWLKILGQYVKLEFKPIPIIVL